MLHNNSYARISSHTTTGTTCQHLPVVHCFLTLKRRKISLLFLVFLFLSNNVIPLLTKKKNKGTSFCFPTIDRWPVPVLSSLSHMSELVPSLFFFVCCCPRSRRRRKSCYHVTLSTFPIESKVSSTWGVAAEAVGNNILITKSQQQLTDCDTHTQNGVCVCVCMCVHTYVHILPHLREDRLYSLLELCPSSGLDV